MTTPQLPVAEARTQQTFTALMWALSYPGRCYTLPAAGLAAFAALGEALIDLETSFYCADSELGWLLAGNGARQRPPDQAMYQFYPQLDPAALVALAQAPVGSYSYPDESATLLVGCTLGDGQGLRLRGPGIPELSSLQVGGIAAAFWALREQACRYPLGWDVFLVAGDQVVGLPRTTQIEVL